MMPRMYLARSLDILVLHTRTERNAAVWTMVFVVRAPGCRIFVHVLAERTIWLSLSVHSQWADERPTFTCRALSGSRKVFAEQLADYCCIQTPQTSPNLLLWSCIGSPVHRFTHHGSPMFIRQDNDAIASRDVERQPCLANWKLFTARRQAAAGDVQ